MAVWWSGEWLGFQDSAERAEKQGAIVLHATLLQAESFEKAKSKPSELEKNLAKLGNSVQADFALFFDSQGELSSRWGTSEVDPALETPRALSSSIWMGTFAGERCFEVRVPLETRANPLGEIRIRKSLPNPAWMSSLRESTIISAILAFLISWVVLGRNLRAWRSITHSLERASREDFCHRASVEGGAEMQSLARATNQTLDSLMNASVRVQKVYVETALALARTVEAKDKYTSGHSHRVAKYCVEMGEWLNFDPERLETLRLGALLHDIGKVAVPDAVLCKQGTLDDDEFAEMRKHPNAGDRILSAIPGLRDVSDIARSHHERWDGKGYPLGVSGDSIPLEGRICCIADAFDALTTKRSYKPAFPTEKALEIIAKDAGTHFDPELARVFVAIKRSQQSKAPNKVTELAPESSAHSKPTP
jgi:putative nucleotidyltransferase with HDIG domain